MVGFNHPCIKISSLFISASVFLVTNLGLAVAVEQPEFNDRAEIAQSEPAAGGLIIKSGIKAFSHEIDLTVDRSEIINLKAPVSRVSISQSEVAEVIIVNPTQIQLIGKKVGVATLVLWDNNQTRDYTKVGILVHRDVSALEKQLKLVDPGIKIQPIAADDSVILTGEVTNNESAQLAVELAKTFFAKPENTQATAPNATNNSADLNSQLPGSAVPRSAPNVVNLIKVKGQPSTKLELVRSKLKMIDPNIQMDIVPGPSGVEKAILTGRVASAAAISNAINLASVFYGQPGMKVVTGPGGNLVRSGGDASFQNDAFSDNKDINVLQGSVVTDATGNVVSMMRVAEKPQIKCTIKFMDVSRRDLNQLGATLTGTNGDIGYGHFSGAQSALRAFSDLSGTISGNNTGSGWVTGSGTSTSAYHAGVNALAQNFRSGTTQIISINQNLAAALSAFIEKKKIKSLAEPTLTMLSGEKASFLAGGELPIPITGNNGQISVTFKEFGIRLNLIPTVTEDGKIHLQVAPEVSAVDPSNSIVTNGIAIPGLRTRRMQTTLEMNNDETIVLAGLFSQEEIEGVSQFPGLGSIPILGNFFKQRNGDKADNEMMVVITPHIVTTGGEATALKKPEPEAEQEKDSALPTPPAEDLSKLSRK